MKPWITRGILLLFIAAIAAYLGMWPHTPVASVNRNRPSPVARMQERLKEPRWQQARVLEVQHSGTEQHPVRATLLQTLDGTQTRLFRDALKVNPATGEEYVQKRAEMIGDVILLRVKEGVTEADVRASAERRGDGVARRMKASQMYIIHLGQPNVDAVQAAVIHYSKEPWVEAAGPDYIYHICDVPSDPYFDQQWSLHNVGQTGGTVNADIDAPEAWNISTGSREVRVAVLDTGVDYSHPDLAPNIWTNPGESGVDANGNNRASNGIDDDGDGFIDDVHGWNFDSGNNDPRDDNLHGTHLAGIIGAVGNNGNGVAGINWQVSIIPIKWLNSEGGGRGSAAIEGIAYAVRVGAKVINASWGSDQEDAMLRRAIEDAGRAGVLFVASAGNGDEQGHGINNDTNPQFPASFDLPNIISVAATDHEDHLTAWSNFGLRTVDLGAPGTHILSTFPMRPTLEITRVGFRTAYEKISGTSMAAPHVTGVCALVWSVYPELSAAQVKERILSSVSRIPSLEGKCVSGGRLNAAGALRVSSGPFVVIRRFEIHDDENGRANPDETFILSVTLKNVGPSATGDLKTTLSSGDSAVSVLEGSAPVSNLPTSQEATVNYKVHVAAGVSTPHTAPMKVSIQKSDGQGWNRSLSLDIYSRARIAGRVTLSGNPLTGAKVTFSGPLSGEVQTDSSGRYQISCVDGTYSVDVSYADYASPDPVEVAVLPNRDDVNFAFESVTVSGRVIEGETGSPVAGATVDCGGAVRGSLVSGPDGGFSFSGVVAQPSTLTLRARKAGFITTVFSITVPPSSTNIILELRKTGPAWVHTAWLEKPRGFHTATLLNDGRVLAVSDDSAEVYDPTRATWATAGHPSLPRTRHTATLLDGARVLVVGGLNEPGQAACEIFDASSGQWMPAGSLAQGRYDHIAVTLNDGRVIVIGGRTSEYRRLATCEVFDPATRTWAKGPAMKAARVAHTATKLADGRVLVVGGFGNESDSDPGTTCEILDANATAWRAAAPLPKRRVYHSAILLSRDRVLVMGYEGCDIYDAATDAWRPTAAMGKSRNRQGTVMLPSGQVLVTGGLSQGEAIASCELFDPERGTWQDAGRLGIPRLSHTATLLQDGRVLVAGGFHGGELKSCELYRTIRPQFENLQAEIAGLTASCVVWGDYNRDGNPDALVMGIDSRGRPVTKIYRNDGGGVFTDIHAALPQLAYGAAAWGDIDGDGYPDLVIVGHPGRDISTPSVSRILRNAGHDVFVDTFASIESVGNGSVAFGDVNGDGSLDLVVTGYHLHFEQGISIGYPVAKLYLNNGHGVFSDAHANLTPMSSGAAIWGDYDGDGRPDLLLTGYNAQMDRRFTILYHNNGGTLVDSGVQFPGLSSSSAAWGDYDGDGHLDLAICGFASQEERVCRVYRNDHGMFVDSGMTLFGEASGAIAWGDYDGDGHLDLLVTGSGSKWDEASTRLYRNDHGTLVEDLESGLPDVTGTHSIAWGDQDRDGRPDILLSGYNGDPVALSGIFRNNGR